MNSRQLSGSVASPSQPDRRTYWHSVYGLRLRTAISLTVPQLPEGSPFDIDVTEGDPDFFAASLENVPLKKSWAQAHRLPEGWLYARIERVVDFMVSPDGSQVLYRPLREFSTASFETYTLGLLMKAVLIKKDVQSLHASAVVVDGQAIAFLGCNGVGKSSLAASFVSAGYPLLTDDLLRVDSDDTRVWAYPGPAFLKLLRDVSQTLQGGLSAAVPMDPLADKYLIQVAADLQCQQRAPLVAIYSLAGPDDARETAQIAIERLNSREALAEVIYGTHTDRVVEPDRATSVFDTAKRIIRSVAVRRLTYPWELASLPQVRNAVLADVRGVESR